MINTSGPAPAVNTSQDRHSARRLIDRIAAGDQTAFRRLCATLHKRVWQTAIRALPQPLDARAVTRATFLEVWHLAGHHVHDPPADVRGWVTTITTRHINERLRTLDVPHPLLDDYDRHVQCEITELLDPGPSRTSNRPRNLRPRRRPRP